MTTQILDSLIKGDINSTDSVLITQYSKYNTEETLIGEWINGKPLYRKVITGTSSNTSDIWKIIYTMGSNVVETLVNLYGYIDNYLAINYNDGSTYSIASFNPSTGNISLRTSYSHLLNKPVTIIIEYTKVED